jgi:large repetitive protein
MNAHRLFRRLNIRSTRPLRARRRPVMEILEGRQLLSANPLTVYNTNDSGAGSLRSVITYSNGTTNTSANTITFDISGTGVQTISPLSALPIITHPVIINGFTQPGATTTPLIVLDGTKAGSTALGLDFHASNSEVEGLAIDNFGASGVQLLGTSKDVITGDYIGVTAAGNVKAGNGDHGVDLIDAANGNTVSDDVISANGDAGIDLNGSNDNVVAGNFIGTDSTGSHAMKNTDDGILIHNLATGNTVGGTTTAARNIISANGQNGVEIDTGSDSNVVEGDYIGTDVSGTLPLGNVEVGVLILGNDNTIGGSTSAAGDVISANLEQGVHITDGSTGNKVEADFIGTDFTGTQPLGNGTASDPDDHSGVLIDYGSWDNTIGGTTAAKADVISDNGYAGVHIETTATGNVVEGDYIGTDLTGTIPLGNKNCGVIIEQASDSNTIGGSTAGARDIISANTGEGVKIATGSNDNVVDGDFIGTDSTGAKALPNTNSGVLIEYGSASNTIGGTSAGKADVISGNTLEGVVFTTGSLKNKVEGDFIGTDLTGTKPLGNGTQGVLIETGSLENTIGGTTSAARNVISANTDSGVDINTGSDSNVIEGDDIGTNASGSNLLANGLNGVIIQGASAKNIIGGSGAAADVISDNKHNGVELDDAAGGNVIKGDTIEANGGSGVYLPNSPSNTVISCTIENNQDWGILMTGSSVGKTTLTTNTVKNNTAGNIS